MNFDDLEPKKGGAGKAAGKPDAPAEPYAAIIRSKILREDIIILKDRKMLKKLRKECPGMVIYLPEEIDKLEKFKGDHAAIRLIHLAKKQFCGWIF